MSKADKMFEELGYKKIGEADKDYDSHYIRYEKSNMRIIFKLENGKICKMGNNRNYISTPELKAINKKVEELGWNE